MQATDSGTELAENVGADLRIRTRPRATLRCEVLDALMAKKGARSKAEQARRLGMNLTHWKQIRSGEITPTVATAMRVAAYCETAVEALWVRAA